MNNHPITKIEAEEILDSRNNPTIKVTVYTEIASDSFSVPSGASTGTHEAYELRDEDKKGVASAIKNINEIISPGLIGQNICEQKNIDNLMCELDGTPQKTRLGGNAIIGVSIACAKTAAKSNNLEVYEYLKTLADIKISRINPLLYMNLINGGKHAKNDLAFQEYHIIPFTEDPKEAVEMGIKIQNSLEKIIENELGKEELVLGDEGGFAPHVENIKKPLTYFTQAIKENGLEGKVRLALDVAASSFYNNGEYFVDGKNISKDELLNIYKGLIEEFDLLSIEDPFNEEDFEGFEKIKNESGIYILGDDLTVTNKVLLQKAIDKNSINAMIIKPNQIGTLSETLETMKLARDNNVELVISHRSGETDDDFIADLTYAFGCFGIKSGSPKKSERMIKYQRLIDISRK